MVFHSVRRQPPLASVRNESETHTSRTTAIWTDSWKRRTIYEFSFRSPENIVQPSLPRRTQSKDANYSCTDAEGPRRDSPRFVCRCAPENVWQVGKGTNSHSFVFQRVKEITMGSCRSSIQFYAQTKRTTEFQSLRPNHFISIHSPVVCLKFLLEMFFHNTLNHNEKIYNSPFSAFNGQRANLKSSQLQKTRIIGNGIFQAPLNAMQELSIITS